MITIKKTLCVDATAVLKDTLGATISTTPIASGASEDITAPDGTAENSDATYSVLVPSGATVIMPNINFTDSDGITTSVPSNKDITATLCGGGASISTATLMRTGATVSYRTGDDSDTSSEGRATDFFTLAENNPFGTTDRFTDEIGTQTYADDIVIDWSTYNGSTVLGWDRIKSTGNVTWDTAIDDSLTKSIGTFTTGWRLPNFNEIISIMCWGRSGPNFLSIKYSPFTINSSSAVALWCSTTAALTTQAFRLLNTNTFQLVNKTGSAYYISCRTFTVTGTTLT